jgi:MerR family transcriptional regulator/heat shock protein HspR
MARYSREPNRPEQDEPMFVISVAARLVEMHPQTLRYYERAGLVTPKRSRGHIRLYSQGDIERLRKIARLVDNLGVNLAGVEVILNLTEKLELLQQILLQYQIELPEILSSNEPGEIPDHVAPELESAVEPELPQAPPKPGVRRPRENANSTETPKHKRSNRNGRSNDRTFGAR